jgi:hypothetical protein
MRSWHNQAGTELISIKIALSCARAMTARSIGSEAGTARRPVGSAASMSSKVDSLLGIGAPIVTGALAVYPSRAIRASLLW